MPRQRYMNLARLVELRGDDLKAEWARRHGAPAPNLSTDLLRLGIGYRLQEARLGGVSRGTRSLLRQVAARAGKGKENKPLPRKMTPGTRLVRDWHGGGHTVTVLDKGFEYDGQHWTSLSAIARTITGQHWNGPRFFGLSERKRP